MALSRGKSVPGSLLCECHQQRIDLNSRYVHFRGSRKLSSITDMCTMIRASGAVYDNRLYLVISGRESTH